MTFKSIIKDLKDRQFEPIYFLHGEEGYFIDAITSYIENHALSDAEKAFNQVVVYGKEVDFKSIVDNARQFPMMAERRVVIIKEAQDFKAYDKLITYFEKPSEQSIVVFAHKHKKLDGRSKLSKVLKQHAVVFESKPLRDYQLPEWINNYAKEEGYKIEPSASLMIGEYLGADLSKIANEFEKLVVNLQKGATITRSLVHEKIGISKDYNIFELQNALGKKDKSRSFQIAYYFANNIKKHPIVLLNGWLYNFFTKVMLTVVHKHETDQVLAKKIGLPTAYFVKDYRLAARNYNMSQIIKIFEFIKNADARSKGLHNRSTPQESILKELIFKIINVA